MFWGNSDFVRAATVVNRSLALVRLVLVTIDGELLAQNLKSPTSAPSLTCW